MVNGKAFRQGTTSVVPFREGRTTASAAEVSRKMPRCPFPYPPEDVPQGLKPSILCLFSAWLNPALRDLTIEMESR
jgi:hypothetical protein